MEISAQEKIQLKLGISPLRGTLGDANGVVYEPGRAGFYRVRYAASNGTLGLPSFVRLRPGIALNPKPGLPVLIGLSYDDQFEIIGGDATRAIEAGFNLVQQNPADPFNKPINQAEIITALSHQTQIASKSVVVKPWVFFEGATIYTFLGATVDLTSYIPASGYHCLVLLVVNPDMTIDVYPSTDKLLAEDLTIDEDLQECLTDAITADADNKPTFAWRLHDDQSVITNEDRWMDCRQIINSSMTSSATAAPINATYITQTPNSTLTNEQALSSLATGYVKNTTGTGILSVQAAPIPVADGGTGAASLTANNVLLGNGTSTLQVVAPGSSGNVLTSNGTTWQSTQLAHSDLTGLTSGDPHTQYVYLSPTSASRNVVTLSDAVTNAVTNVVTLGHNSSGTPAANFGTGLAFQGHSSSTINRDMGRIKYIWGTATDASRVSNIIFSLYSTSSEHDVATFISAGLNVVGLGNDGRFRVSNTSNDPTTKYIELLTSVDTPTIRNVGYGQPLSILSNSRIIISPFHSAGAPSDSVVIDTLRVGNGAGTSSNPTLNSAGGLGIWASDPNSDLLVIGTPNSTHNRPLISVTQNSLSRFYIAGNSSYAGFGTSSPAAHIHVVASDAATDVTNVGILGHNTSGTVAAGLGTGLLFQIESSTTDNRDAGRIVALWDASTDASRSADLIFYAYYTSTAREGIRIRGGSSNAQIGFLGATPISQYSTTGTTTGFTAGAGGAVDSAATFTGNTGSTAYTIGDIVRALKQYGLLTA